MNKVEFGDYYKFLTSLGLALMASAVVLPWLLIKESPSIVPTAELDRALPIVSSTMEKRWEQYDRIITLWPWLTVGLASIGFILLISGAKKWKARQATKDTQEDERFSSEMRQMQPQEVLLNALEEARDSVAKSGPSEESHVAAVANAINIEETVISKVKESYGDLNVRAHMAIGDAGIDAVAEFGNCTLIIEIKYSRTGALHPTGAIKQLTFFLTKIAKQHSRTYLGLVVLVQNSKRWADESRFTTVRPGLLKDNDSNVGLMILSPEEISDLPGDYIRMAVNEIWPPGEHPRARRKPEGNS